jgi:hypothetical protein
MTDIPAHMACRVRGGRDVGCWQSKSRPASRCALRVATFLRRVGRDTMISFKGSSYSMAARATDRRMVRAGQQVEVRLENHGGDEQIVIRRLPAHSPDGTALELAHHPRGGQRGQRVVDPGPLGRAA